MKSIAFLLNPKAGPFRNIRQHLNRAIEHHLDREHFKVEIIETSSPEALREAARIERDKGTDILAVVGGDGSVNIVAHEIEGTETLLAIIPAGSGNGLARHLGIPIRTAGAMKLINDLHHTLIDTARINDLFFVSIAGIGFDAYVAAEYARSKMRGLLPYVRIVLRDYYAYKPRKYKIVVDGQVIVVRALFIAFANSDQFGYNTRISPKARASDGLLDVVIFRKVPVIKLPQLLAILFRKEIDQTGYATILKAKQVVVTRRSQRFVNVDGESMKLPKRLFISVRPGQLRVITPRDSVS